jgi:hypothetical protein
MTPSACKGKLDVRHFELQVDDIFQGGRRINVQILRPAQQAHARQNPDQPEIMVSM